MEKLKLKYYKSKLKKATNETDIKKYQINIIKYSSFFDKEYYMYTYNIKGIPFIHFLEEGYKLGYNPSPKFQTDLYYKMYPDVKEANINPLLHYELHGKDEQRLPGIPAIDQGIYYPKKIQRFILRDISKLINIYKKKQILK